MIENRNVKNHSVIGDFNIDTMYTRNYDNNINQEFLNNFLAYEYFPCFHGVTRPSSTGQGGSCIDNFFIKSSTTNVKPYNITNPFNDHFPLFVQFNNVKISYSDKKIKTKINYYKLTNIAKDVDWNRMVTTQEPNCAIDEIIMTINQCVEKVSIVIKQKRSDRNFTPRQKWITKAIIVSCKKKELLYNMRKKNKESITLKKEYIDYAKILNRVIKDAKVEYEKNRINDISNDSKQLWKIINEKIGKNKKKSR